MKNNKTNFKIIFLMGLFLLLAFTLFIEIPRSSSFEEKEEPKISGTNVDYEIKINGLGEGSEWGYLSWQQAASQYGFQGTGAENDPYIIASKIWNPSTWVDTIDIIDSDKHFIIRNCEFYNAYNAIRLRSVKNGKVLNNYFENNIHSAIYLYRGLNIQISENTVEGQQAYGFDFSMAGAEEHKIWGKQISILNNNIDVAGDIAITLLVRDSIISGNRLSASGIGLYIGNPYTEPNVIIKDNIISNCFLGIDTWGLKYFSFINNKISNCEHVGIYLSGNIGHNLFVGNEFRNTNIGVKTYSQTGLYYRFHEFRANIFSDNNIGLDLGMGCQENTVKKNVFENNDYGVLIEGDSNLIFDNLFSDNNYNAIDDGNNNLWDNEEIGNYWYDYSGEDTDKDGIGDTPYNIGGSASSQDNFPIFSAPVDFAISRQDIDYIDGRIVALVTNLHFSYKRDIYVRFIEEIPGGASIIIGEQIINGLDKNEFKTISIIYEPKLYHNITVIIDPYNIALDIDRKNNIAKRGGGGSAPQITSVSSAFGVWEGDNIVGTFFSNIEQINTFTIEIYDLDQDIDEVIITLNDDSITATTVDGIVWEFEYDMTDLYFGDNDLNITVRDVRGLQSELRTINLKAVAIPEWLNKLMFDLGAVEINIDYVAQTYEFILTIEIGEDDENNMTKDVSGVPFFEGESSKYKYSLEFSFKYDLAKKEAHVSAAGIVEADLFGAHVKGSLTLSAAVDENLNLLSTEIAFDLDISIPILSRAIIIPGISLTISCGIIAGVHITVRTIFEVIENTLQWTTFEIISQLYIYGYLDLRIDLGWVGGAFSATLGGSITIDILTKNGKFNLGIIGNLKMIWTVSWKLLFISGTIGGSIEWDFKILSPAEVNQSSEVEPWAFSENPENLMDSRPRVATDKDKEDAMMIWTQNRDDGDNIFTDICYSTWNGDDWEEAKYITFDDQPDYDPALTYDSNGNVMAVWSRVTGDLSTLTPDNPFEILKTQEIAYSIWDGESWSPPKLITNDDDANGRVVVSGGPDGKILAAWVGDSDHNFTTSTDMELYYSQWDGTSWTPKNALTNNENMDYSATLAYDSEGNAMICWVCDLDGNRTTIEDRELRYEIWNGESWGTSGGIITSEENSDSPSITFDNHDNALLTWVSESENHTRLYFSSYNKEMQEWSESEIVHEDNFFIYNPAINVDSDNTAVIVWRGFEDDEQEKLYYLEHNTTATYFDGEICYATKNITRIDSKWSEIKYLTSDNKTDWMASAVIIKGNSNDLLLVWDKDGVVESLIHEIKPDLVVSNVTFSDPYPSENDEIDITATIHNKGDVKAEEVNVSFYMGDPNDGGINIGSQVIDFIDFDEEIEISIPWTAESGTSTIFVVVDPLNQVSEINETNNMGSKVIEIFPDLYINPTDIFFSNSNPVENEHINIFTTVHNLGGAKAESININFYSNGNIIGTATVPILEIGDSEEVFIEWNTLAGINALTVSIDPDNQISEWDETNNNASKTLSILPDVVVNSFETSKDVLLLGESIIISGEIQNIGHSIADNVIIEFFDGNPYTDGIYLGGQTIALNVGQTQQISFDGWTPAEGTHQIFMVVDRGNLIKERNEVNNLKYKEIAVVSLPDLLIIEPEITITENYLSLNTPIENVGQGGTTGVLVELFDGDPFDNGNLITSQILSHLNSYETDIVVFNLVNPPLNDNLHLLVDSANFIKESDETNNHLIISYSQILTINAGPNQVVQEGDEVEFSATAFISNIEDFTFIWDFGDGDTEQGSNVFHNYGDNGEYLVSLTVTGPNFYGTDILYVTVINVAPIPTISGLSEVEEGSTYTLSIEYVDPGADDIQWEINWGDETIEFYPGDITAVDHEYTDGPYSHTITATVTDDDEGIGSDTTTITVNNVAPTIHFVEDRVVEEDKTYSYSWEIIDPGILDWHTYTINWADGNEDTGEILAGIYSVSVAHNFTLPGVYTVKMTLTDKDGGYDILTFKVEVLDKTPPTSTLTIQDPYYGVDPYYVSTATIFILSAVDAEMDHGSGVKIIQYRIDDGINITHLGSVMTFTLTEIGPHTVYYLSIDEDGNVEEEKSIEIVVNASELTYLGEFEGTYSDPVILKANLSDIATGLPIPYKTIVFTIGTQTVTAETNLAGVASFTLILNQSSGEYTVYASFANDGEYLASDDKCAFTINKEYAYAEYTGDMVVPLDAKFITLRATIFDQDDGNWGNLSKIWVNITIWDSTTVTPLDPDIYEYILQVKITIVEGVGVADINIPNTLSEGSYLVQISFDPNANDYYLGDISIPVVLIIYNPTGDFVTGGGWIEDANGNRGNFGFNIKYKKNGLPKGQAIFVYREGGYVFIVKANAWVGMAIISADNYTIFEAKCNIKQVNCTTGEIVWEEGNYRLIIEAWDHSNEGKGDIIQIRVLDKIGLIYYEAGFDPYGHLMGGNIVIHIDEKKE